jgi:lipoprotein-releasing system permease protein
MSPNLRIAFRFLTANKRSMLMSLSCIVLGIGLFIVTQATTSGFEEFFIKTILGTNGAIKVEDRIQDTIRTMEAGGGGSSSKFQVQQKEGYKFVDGIDEPKLVMDALREFPNVSGISEVLTGNAMLRSSFSSAPVDTYGIILENHLAVSELAGQIVQGRLEEFRDTPSGILIGADIAEQLQLEIGDPCILNSSGEIRRYRVSGVYRTGVADIDKKRIFMHLSEARSLLKKPYGASFLQVNVYDKERATADADQMESVLRYRARSWQYREKTWLEVFRALRFSSGITVSVFTLIAGLAMFNTLAMIVMEKTKEIAILRSMGYTRRDISRIFIWQAVIVLAIGTILGWMLGAGVTYAVERTPIRVRGIFSSDHFIVAWSIWHYIAATLTAVLMVLTASLVPARRAARLEPGDVIRGTAQ